MSDRIFQTQKEVLEHLHGLGLKVGKSKISSDIRLGRLPTLTDKTFREADVLAYAETLKAPVVKSRKDFEDALRLERDDLIKVMKRIVRAVPDMDKLYDIFKACAQKNEGALTREYHDAILRLEAWREREKSKTLKQGEKRERKEARPGETKALSDNRALMVEYRHRRHSLTPDQIRQPEIPGGYDKIDSFDPHARFCLTGIFAYGERGDCEKLVTKLGGKVAKRPVLYEQCYVVVGTLASLGWSHTFYGNKIEQGLDYRAQGAPVKIITEDDWIRLALAYEEDGS